jgi:hypothetical protein
VRARGLSKAGELIKRMIHVPAVRRIDDAYERCALRRHEEILPVSGVRFQGVADT